MSTTSLSERRAPTRSLHLGGHPSCPAGLPHNHGSNLFQRCILCPAGVVCSGSQALSPHRVARLRQSSCCLITGWDRQKNGSGPMLQRHRSVYMYVLCRSNREELVECCIWFYFLPSQKKVNVFYKTSSL